MTNKQPKLTPEEQEQLKKVQDAWNDFASTSTVQPVLYNDKGEPVWAGKPLPLSEAKKSEEICAKKQKEFEELGEKAFKDSESLDGIAKAGEVKWSN